MGKYLVVKLRLHCYEADSLIAISLDYYYIFKKRLVNIAAFLSNAMEEGIRIDSCDEWNTDARDDRFPLSNACGVSWLLLLLFADLPSTLI